MNFGWWYVGGWWVPLCFAIIASKWYIDSEEKMLYSSVVPPFHQHSRDYCRHWEGSRFEPGVGGGKLCMFASERYERSAVVGGLFITSAHCLGSLNFSCVLHHSICFCNIYIYIVWMSTCKMLQTGVFWTDWKSIFGHPLAIKTGKGKAQPSILVNKLQLRFGSCA